MKPGLSRLLVVSAVLPYALYALYVIWAYLSGRRYLGEAGMGYVFMLAFVGSNLLSIACGLALLTRMIRASVSKPSLTVVLCFVVGTVFWWALWTLYGDALQVLPFRLHYGGRAN